MSEEQEERWTNEALELERKLTAYQVLTIVSLLALGYPLNDLAEPEGEASQMLELERLGILEVDDASPRLQEIQLTKKGVLIARWYGALMLEAVGVSSALLS